MGVIRIDSSTLSLAFVMAAMIFVMSKVTSEPFRLITVILIALHLYFKWVMIHPNILAAPVS